MKEFNEFLVEYEDHASGKVFRSVVETEHSEDAKCMVKNQAALEGKEITISTVWLKVD